MPAMITTPPLPHRAALAADALATLRTAALPCLVLATAAAAALACCITTPVLSQGVVNTGSVRVLMALLALPLWLCLLVVFGAAVAAGAFDRLTPRRPLQALLVLAGVTTIAYLSGRGAMLNHAGPVLLLPTLAVLAAATLLWQRRGGR